MKLSQPVNVWPEDIDAEIRKHFLKEVTSPMMYESSTKTFHPEGLYSEAIFGQIGSPARIGTLAYIDLHCTVLEPLVYLNVIKLASWYQDIMESRTWAIWDDKLKDFTPSEKDEPDANTGFAFFMEHVKDINFEFNSSRSRANRIKSVQKFFESGCAFKTKCLVAPAGWRDVKINENGRDEVDEVNKLYTSLLIMSREVKTDIVTPELIPFFNSAKYHIQLKVVELFEYWKNFWEGKGGYGQSRYNKRMLALGTRNVIATATLQAESPKDPRYIKHNETQTPIFLAAKQLEPSVVHALNRLFFSPIYTLGSVQIPAIDPDTLEIVYIEIPASDVTYALGTKSKHDFINSFEDPKTRMDTVTVRDVNGKEFYLWMIYDLGDKIYMFRSLSDLENLLNYDQNQYYSFDTENEMSPPVVLAGIDPLTETDLSNLVASALPRIRDILNIQLDKDKIQFALSDVPIDMDGKINDTIPRDQFGGCWVNQGAEFGTVYLNPKINLAIQYYTHSPTISSMTEYQKEVESVLVHEVMHGLWMHSSEAYRNEVLGAAKKANFTSPYLEAIKDQKPKENYDQEVFCEYLASQVVDPKKTRISIVKEKCRPITKCEMLYIALCGISKKYCTMTRYPAVEMGSIYPSKIVVLTTAPSRVVSWKSQWDPRVEMVLPHYPILSATSYYEGTVIHPSKTPNLTADYDGDKLSQNGILTKEAIEEVESQLESPLNIISPSGKFLDTLSTQSVRFALIALTRIPEGAEIPTIED